MLYIGETSRNTTKKYANCSDILHNNNFNGLGVPRNIPDHNFNIIQYQATDQKKKNNTLRSKSIKS